MRANGDVIGLVGSLIPIFTEPSCIVRFVEVVYSPMMTMLVSVSGWAGL